MSFQTVFALDALLFVFCLEPAPHASDEMKLAACHPSSPHLTPHCVAAGQQGSDGSPLCSPSRGPGHGWYFPGRSGSQQGPPLRSGSIEQSLPDTILILVPILLMYPLTQHATYENDSNIAILAKITNLTCNSMKKSPRDSEGKKNRPKSVRDIVLRHL